MTAPERRPRRARATATARPSAAPFGASTPVSKALLDDAPPAELAGLPDLGAAPFPAPAMPRGSGRGLLADRRRLLRLGGAVLLAGDVGPVVLLLGPERAGHHDHAHPERAEGVPAPHRPTREHARLRLRHDHPHGPGLHHRHEHA